MKHIPNIVGGLLGFLFVVFGLMFFFGPPPPAMPPDTPIDHIMKAFGPTGYMAFVKVLEVVGGVLVAIPKTRNYGLLVLGPILINIICFHVLILGGKTDPFSMVLVPVLSLLALYLLWAGRRNFAGLLNTQSKI